MNHLGMSHAPTRGDINPGGTFGQPSARGFLYDVNGAWNFGQRQFLNTRVSPYVVAGVGGLTTEIRSGTASFVGGGPAVGTLHDDDTFFTVNYGGGVKAM